MEKITEMRATVYLKPEGGRNVFFAIRGESGQVVYMSASSNQDSNPGDIVLRGVKTLAEQAANKLALAAVKDLPF